MIFRCHRLVALALATVLLGVANAAETRLLSYAVDMTISSRFARTHITVEIGNDRDDCTEVTGFAFQLPINARVTDMTMITIPGNCEKTGVVKEIHLAEQEFAHQAQQGQSAALLKAYDSTQYGIQVSLPPSAVTTIDIHLEELLHRYRGQVDFRVPIYAGLEIEELTVDIAIQEPQSGVARFGIVRDYDNVDPALLNSMQVLPSDFNRPVASAHLEVQGVPASAGYYSASPLPRLLRGYYDPGPLPPDGLLLRDPFGKCFVHLVNPDTLLATTGSLPRNIVFVIDVSGSMSGQKLDDAKAAFSAIIDRLTSDDYFAVQTFSTKAVKERFGPYLATDDVKVLARDWVNSLRTMGSTNLEGAYIEGIRQVQSMQTESLMLADDGTFVPIVLLLTDGQPTVGETYPRFISRNVRYANHDEELQLSAKIYGLAFGDDADFALLSAISLQNGGRTVRIYEGYGNAVDQMEEFFEGELGTVVMVDVHVTFDGSIDSQTQTLLPVFAEGSELTARARVLGDTVSGVTGATTAAATGHGPMTWHTDVSPSAELSLSNERNECIQSFAHQKIAELMDFRDACVTVGSEEMADYYDGYSLYNGHVPAEVQRMPGGGLRRHQQELDICRAVEQEALQLALEAAVVWPGITAMVTVDSAACSAAALDVPICVEDETLEDEMEETEGDPEDDTRYVTGAPTAEGTSSLGSHGVEGDGGDGYSNGGGVYVEGDSDGFAEGTDSNAVAGGTAGSVGGEVQTGGATVGGTAGVPETAGGAAGAAVTPGAEGEAEATAEPVAGDSSGGVTTGVIMAALGALGAMMVLV